MSAKHALLIAVDYYYPHSLPGGYYYPSLGGCVRDIDQVEIYLVERLGMTQDDIIKLTSTDVGTEKLAESPIRQPTYRNMAKAFQDLVERAQKGDQVYIHYSGHGGRARTIFPDLKGTDGLDECLVPCDIGQVNSRYLRDVELAYLLNELVKKEVHLTVVFDSCHSGGASRGIGKVAVRGISVVDTTDYAQESSVENLETLSAFWQSEEKRTGASRSHKPASGWMLEPKGYTFLAACRASESALEYAFNGHKRSGVLTYWLLDALRQAGPDWSYKMLHDLVLAKVHSQFPRQTPQLQGDVDRQIFGRDQVKSHYNIPVIQTEAGRVQLQAGEAHGVQMGDGFAIYPIDADSFDDPDKQIGLAEVVEVGDVTCWAKMTEMKVDTIEQGSQAVLIKPVQLRRNVSVFIPEDAQLRQQVEQTIEEKGQGFVAVAVGGQPVHFQVAVVDEHYEIWDPSGVELPHLRPHLRVDGPDAFSTLARRLIHLAKYQNVRELTPPVGTEHQKLEVTLSSASQREGGISVFRPGERVKLNVKNLHEPNPNDPNDPSRVLNVSILNLASDWAITQIYPQGGLFEPIDPGASLKLEFQAYLPEGQSESLDVLKVFASPGTTSFRWLELPALDQPELERSDRSARRAAITDPLETMMAKITGDRAVTRNLRPIRSEEKKWTVEQVYLRVKKETMLEELPNRAELPLERSFTLEEYEHIKQGFNAHSMDSKWGIVFEDGWLGFIRSWGGILIFLLHLTETEGEAHVDQAYASREEPYYMGDDDDIDEEMRMVTFLIDRLLLKRPDAVLRQAGGTPVNDLLHHHLVGNV